MAFLWTSGTGGASAVFPLPSELGFSSWKVPPARARAASFKSSRGSGRLSILGQDLSRLAKKGRSRFLASSLSLYSEEASAYLAGSYSYAAKTLGADERKGRSFLRELGFEIASQRFSSLSSGELAASFLSLLLAREPRFSSSTSLLPSSTRNENIAWKRS